MTPLLLTNHQYVYQITSMCIKSPILSFYSQLHVTGVLCDCFDT